MSNALPAALLRPSCAALRTSASAPAVHVHQWSAVTAALARRFCSPQTYTPCNRRSGILSALQVRHSRFSDRQCRSFSSAPRLCAKVAKPSKPIPSATSTAARNASASKKRIVRIGPLPCGEVDGNTIKEIFGQHVPYAEGNHALRILHHRRVSGSLVDYGVGQLGSKFPNVDHATAVKGLEWLRQAFPVDEARAAEEWAEKEANRISYEMWLSDPENADSKYNDPARIWREQQKEIEQGENEDEIRMGLLRQGPSQFERHLRAKRQERLDKMAKEAEKKEKEEEEMEKKIASGEYVRTPSGKGIMKPGQETYVDIWGREHVSHYKELRDKYEKAGQSGFETPEEMMNATTLTQRLAPMTAFVFAVCMLSLGFGYFYIPPDAAHRLWPDMSPTVATLAAITGINVFVCLAWRFNPLWFLLMRYGMHVPGYPRAFQAIGNVFSHIQYEHLLSNMAFLWLCGSVCHDLVGRGIFLGTYLSAGAFGTLASLYWANLGRGNITAHSVGASAAVWGIGALYCLLTEAETIKIPLIKDQEVGFYPKVLLCAFIAMELRLIFFKKTTIDHASHLGGLLVGALVAGYLRLTGFHERRMEAKDGVMQRADGEESAEALKTVDVEKMVKEEVKEVKNAVANRKSSDSKDG